MAEPTKKKRKRRPKDPIVLDPWELQPGEPTRAFSAFKVYRDTPSYKRSIVKCCTAYWARHDESKVRQWERWSSEWEWVRRVEEYERWEDAETRRTNEDAIEKMRKRHGGIALMLINKAIKKLEGIKESEISVRESLSFLTEAVRMERLSMGDVDTLIGIVGVDVTKLTDAELKAIAES